MLRGEGHQNPFFIAVDGAHFDMECRDFQLRNIGRTTAGPRGV